MPLLFSSKSQRSLSCWKFRMLLPALTSVHLSSNHQVSFVLRCFNVFIVFLFLFYQIQNLNILYLLFSCCALKILHIEFSLWKSFYSKSALLFAKVEWRKIQVPISFQSTTLKKVVNFGLRLTVPTFFEV